MLGANTTPREIWLQIASYLTISEIKRLASVHRVFAALASESWAKERATFVLNIATDYSGTGITHADWGNTTHKLMKQMLRYIRAGFASDVTHLVWSSNGAVRRGDRRYFVQDLWRWLYALARGRSVTSRLPAIYNQFSAVDTLSFLQDSLPSRHAPRCIRLMAPDAMWGAFAPRLRELSLTVNTMGDLDLIFPSPGAWLTLPRLEVLRFAYLREYLSVSDAPATNVAAGIAYMVTLLNSVRETLQTLQIHLHYYLRNGVIIITSLLPEDIVFPRLRRVDLVVEESPLRDPAPAHQRHIWRFIQDHAATLRIVKLGRLLHAVNLLVDDPPIGFIHDHGVGDQPRIALSLELPPTARLFDPMAGNASLRACRSSIASLSLYNTSGMNWLQLGVASFHNLRHLSLDWSHMPEVGVNSFLPVVRYAPQIISLGIRHGVWSDDYLGLQTDDATRAELLDWGLQDLSVHIVTIHQVIVPCWRLLRRMKHLVPAIKSFNGQGHTELETVREFGGTWPWEDNKFAGLVLTPEPLSATDTPGPVS